MAFGGFDQAGGNAPMSEINTTPLVDVMLVLLIIFMITAPLMTHAVKIDLPQASSTPAEDKPETISLSVDAEGLMFWNDAPLDKSALEQRLAEAAALDPNPSCIFGRIARPVTRRSPKCSPRRAATASSASASLPSQSPRQAEPCPPALRRIVTPAAGRRDDLPG